MIPRAHLGEQRLDEVLRLLLKLVSLVAILLELSGALVVALTLASLYMVLFEGIRPGEPIWMDELAPSTGNACLQAIGGAAMIGLAVSARAFIRRKLQSVGS